MSDKKDIVSDFEELLKLKEFQRDNEKKPYECTYEQISKSLSNEYVENIDEKIRRWLSVTHFLYFEDVVPVKFYLQAKMLFRDGFYEAAITISRSICEMICYEILTRQNHPFGTYEELELENFRTLVKFLAIPKKIEKDIFNSSIIEKLDNQDEKNFLKSAYALDAYKSNFDFKLGNGKSAKNLNRFFSIFDRVGFDNKDNFPRNIFETINQVYDNGNTYVHARKSLTTPKEDAINSLNKIGEALFGLYGVSEIPINQLIKSGYTDFPDIGTGMNFALDAYNSLENAMRGYLNLPSQKQMEKMISVQGEWKGEWTSQRNINIKGHLSFRMDGEYLLGELTSYDNDEEKIKQPLDIKLFGHYFHIKGFNPDNMKHDKSKHNYLELEFFNDDMLIGMNLIDKGKVIFKRIK